MIDLDVVFYSIGDSQELYIQVWTTRQTRLPFRKRHIADNNARRYVSGVIFSRAADSVVN